MNVSLARCALLVGMSACAAANPPAASAPVERTDGTFLDREYTDANGTRSYKLFVPAGYEDTHPAPLIVMLHGCTQDAADFAAGTRMNELAGEYGFLVLYPEQPASAHPQKCWNWYDPAHQRRGTGEPALIAGMADEVMREFTVDSDRVYIAGISAGAAMALNIAASYPERFAAVASHSGVAYGVVRDVAGALATMRNGPAAAAENPDAVLAAMGAGARPIPLIVFHGSADPVVSSANTAAVGRQWTAAAARLGRPTVDAVEEAGSERNGYSFRRTMQCDPSETLLLDEWIVEGLGHAWSGGSPDGTYTDPQGPDASREIVRFFLDHPRTPVAGQQGSGR